MFAPSIKTVINSANVFFNILGNCVTCIKASKDTSVGLVFSLFLETQSISYELAAISYFFWKHLLLFFFLLEKSHCFV